MSSVIKSFEFSHKCDFSDCVLVGMDSTCEDESLDAEIEEIIPEEPSAEEIAAEIIAAAQKQAASLVDNARNQAKQVHDEAWQTGYSEGLSQGKVEWDSRILELEKEFDLQKQQLESTLDEAEPELAKLSVSIARKVIKQELMQDPNLVISVVRAAIHRVKDKHIRILVHPSDLEIVRKQRENFLEIAEQASEIEIESDRRIGQGGCILETDNGNLDARLETQLNCIAETISVGIDESHDAPQN